MKRWVRRAAEVLVPPVLVFFVFMPLFSDSGLTIRNYLSAAALALILLALSWRGWSREDEAGHRRRK